MLGDHHTFKISDDSIGQFSVIEKEKRKCEFNCRHRLTCSSKLKVVLCENCDFPTSHNNVTVNTVSKATLTARGT